MTYEFNPQPMFGKHKFINEQFILNDAMIHSTMATSSILKESDILVPYIGIISFEKRRELAKSQLGKAIDKLKELGV